MIFHFCFHKTKMEQTVVWEDVPVMLERKTEKWRKTGGRRGTEDFGQKKRLDLFQIVCYNARNEHGAPGKTDFSPMRRVQFLCSRHANDKCPLLKDVL